MAPAASTAREASALGGARFSPAGAEPWGGEGGGLEAPAARPSWFGRTRARFRNSVWAPVALKLVGLAFAMLALSGVGVASMLSGVNGVEVPLAGMLGADIHTSWLQGKPAPAARAEPSPLAALAAATPVAPLTADARATASNVEPVTPAAGDAHRTGAAPDGTSESARATASTGRTEDGKIILNLASSEDLRHLPGVGAKRAEAILALRTRLGRFKQVSDLLRVKGIGVRGLKKIMPHVVLDAPKPAA